MATAVWLALCGSIPMMVVMAELLREHNGLRHDGHSSWKVLLASFEPRRDRIPTG
jgi:hypothetical protein